MAKSEQSLDRRKNSITITLRQSDSQRHLVGLARQLKKKKKKKKKRHPIEGSIVEGSKILQACIFRYCSVGIEILFEKNSVEVNRVRFSPSWIDEEEEWKYFFEKKKKERKKERKQEEWRLSKRNVCMNRNREFDLSWYCLKNLSKFLFCLFCVQDLFGNLEGFN